MRRIIRKKFRKFWKSVINRRLVKYASRFSLAIFLLAAVLSFGKIQRTNSFFSDTASVTGNTMTAGYWIPVLTMSVDPGSYDGNDGWYKTSPCVTLTASVVTDVTIYYEFSNDGNPVSGGTAYSGSCVPIPNGNPTQFQAQAVNNLNSDWKSNIVSGQFKVDTIKPVVDITAPVDGSTVSGSVPIRGTVTDANPKNYRLKIKNSASTTIYDSGDVSSGSFTNQLLYTWDTSTFADGDYTIELKGEDQAGNQTTDVITVTVDNQIVGLRDVIINEVMWMGSKDAGNPADDGPNDQWVELKNVSGHDLRIKGWYLTYKNESTSNENKLAEIGNNWIVKDGEYFLLAHYNKSNSAINEQRDDDMANFDINKFQIKLYTDKNKTVLVDTAGSGDKEPTKGNKTNFYSMERNSTPGDGSNYTNWYTCLDAGSTSLYWDSGRTERGTPGHQNMSHNDPTSLDLQKELDSKPEGDTLPVAPDITETPPAGEGTSATNNTDNTEIANTTTDTTTRTDTPPETGATQDEPVLVKKEFDINLKGKLDVPDGFEADVSQKMKKIELSGEEKVINDLKDFEIDLAKIEIKKEDKIEITVSDLDLPKDVELVLAKKDDVVVLITVTKKEEEPEKDGNSSDAKDTKINSGTDDAKLNGNNQDNSDNGEKDKEKDKEKGKGTDGQNNGDTNSPGTGASK